MGAFLSFLQPLKEEIRYRFRWRYLWKDWFLGRHACLGVEILKHYDQLPKEVNFQKGRSDLLHDYWKRPMDLPRSIALSDLMQRDDVLPLIRQLEFFYCLPKRAPKFIFMDSFSELTDQLFVNKKDGWKFCCGYSDISNSENFSALYECLGHLPLERLKSAYIALFDLFEDRWGVLPIYFLHFPITLETREIFNMRYNHIVKVIEEISSVRPNIHSIRIDESNVAWPVDAPKHLKSFPYHYDQSTYLRFREQIGPTL